MIGKGMLSIAKAAVAAGPVVFVYKMEGLLNGQIRTALADGWEAMWLRAGASKAPPLCVLDDSATLTSLTDGALREIGLMRIPAESAGTKGEPS